MNAKAPTIPLCLSVSLLANVRLLRDWFKAALDGITGAGPAILDQDDPMGDILAAERQLAMVNEQLCALGYVVPDLAGSMVDPLGFLKANAAFLGKVEPWLVTPLPLDGLVQ